MSYESSDPMKNGYGKTLLDFCKGNNLYTLFIVNGRIGDDRNKGIFMGSASGFSFNVYQLECLVVL